MRWERESHRFYAQLHGLSVQLDGFVVIPLLVLFEGLRDQEVGALQVHLLPRLQRVAPLCLAWVQTPNKVVNTTKSLTKPLITYSPPSFFLHNPDSMK